MMQSGILREEVEAESTEITEIINDYILNDYIPFDPEKLEIEEGEVVGMTYRVTEEGELAEIYGRPPSIPPYLTLFRF